MEKKWCIQGARIQAAAIFGVGICLSFVRQHSGKKGAALDRFWQQADTIKAKRFPNFPWTEKKRG
jgi:hypothetical protein